MGAAECTMMGPLEGVSLNPWPIPDYLRMETDAFFCIWGGKGPEGGQ